MSLLSQVSIHAWILENQIRTETGKVLDFHTHRYLFDVYSDNSKYLCCLKAGQIGFSTMAIIKTMWLSKNRKIDVGYILPTVDMVQKFVGSKVNRMAQQNPAINELMKDKDSITQKQIGENYIHYLGAMTERSAIMISLDMLVADEYDKCPPAILETYDSRLQHSKFGYKWVFSNPTSPDFGVDKFYKMSDQKKWHITHSCGSNYVMDESCIDYNQSKYVCPKCQGVITSEDIRMGEWKSTAQGEWSGYWIPLWINPMIEAKYICDSKKTKTAEYFANYVAGLPYIAGGNKVQASTIIKCLSSDINAQEDRIIIGVDTGLPIHYVLANKQGFFHYGKCSDPTTGKDPYDELEFLLKRFPNSIMIADQGGDLIGIRKLQAKYPGRVFLVWYRADQKGTELIKWGEGQEYGKVVADRNRLIQLMIDEMNDKRVTFSGTESDWQEYITHWLNIYRVWDENALGVRTFKWERNGADHFVHASIYTRIGLSKYSDSKARIVGASDMLFEGIDKPVFNNFI